jgi:Spy/CpxP family protein refolding chaperone
MRTVRNWIIAAAVISLVGLGASAFAHGGKGWGGGYGNHGPGGNSGCGKGYGDSLSEEEVEQIERQREAFFEQTQDLRSSLREKRRELRSELSNDEPDAVKAAGLQQEISELRAQLDQKRIEHVIEMKKLNPNAGIGYGRHMRGHGPRGGGDCWR